MQTFQACGYNIKKLQQGNAATKGADIIPQTDYVVGKGAASHRAASDSARRAVGPPARAAFGLAAAFGFLSRCTTVSRRRHRRAVLRQQHGHGSRSVRLMVRQAKTRPQLPDADAAGNREEQVRKEAMTEEEADSVQCTSVPAPSMPNDLAVKHEGVADASTSAGGHAEQPSKWSGIRQLFQPRRRTTLPIKRGVSDATAVGHPVVSPPDQIAKDEKVSVAFAAARVPATEVVQSAGLEKTPVASTVASAPATKAGQPAKQDKENPASSTVASAHASQVDQIAQQEKDSSASAVANAPGTETAAGAASMETAEQDKDSATVPSARASQVDQIARQEKTSCGSALASARAAQVDQADEQEKDSCASTIVSPAMEIAAQQEKDSAASLVARASTSQVDQTAQQEKDACAVASTFPTKTASEQENYSTASTMAGVAFLQVDQTAQQEEDSSVGGADRAAEQDKDSVALLFGAAPASPKQEIAEERGASVDFGTQLDQTSMQRKVFDEVADHRAQQEDDYFDDWDDPKGKPIQGAVNGISLKELLTSVGLEGFLGSLPDLALEELMAKGSSELEDIAEDAGMRKDNRRKFAQAIQYCIQLLPSDAPQALVEFLARKGLEKHAGALYANGDEHVDMLLVKNDAELVDICAEAGFSKDDRRQFLDLVQDEKDRRSAKPSLGGKLFRELRSKARVVENFEGTSLSVMYLPFQQPPTFTHTYTFKFPKGSKPKTTLCSLTVLDVDVPQKFIDPSIQQELYILVIGATGSGKSTQIDSMLNHILGLKWKEPCRFKLVDESTAVTKAGLQAGQAASQTDAVTAYRLPAFRGSEVKAKLTIIDTPGFGDTRGLHFDKKIVDQLTKCFKDCEEMQQHVSGLTGVCFVTQASLPRLTDSQEYIWGAILGLFGKDISENILMSFTFADGKKPQTLAAVEKSKIPMAEHFKFNNSALFADPEEKDDTLSKMFWDMGKDNMTNFFVRLQQMPTKSLRLTREVLEERERLELSLENLQPAVQLMLNTAETLRQETKLIESLTEEQLAAKDFQYETKVMNFKKTPLPNNTNTTTCLECNCTCHANCSFKNDSDKARCIAMDWNGYCRECPGKCKWDMHRNLPYILEWFEDTKTITSEDLKRKYDAATKGKLDKEKLMAGLKKDLEQKEYYTISQILRMKSCKERLYEIAMRPNAMPSEKYLEMLISNERNAQQPGYKARIDALQKLKQKSKLFEEATADDYNPMHAYAADPIFKKFYKPRATAKVLRATGSDMDTLPEVLQEVVQELARRKRATEEVARGVRNAVQKAACGVRDAKTVVERGMQQAADEMTSGIKRAIEGQDRKKFGKRKDQNPSSLGS